MNKTLKGVGILLLFLASAHGQDDYSLWTNHKNLIINTKTSGTNVPGNVTQYPLLVRLTSGNFSDFAAAGTRSSLRFARGAIHLPYQVERWDSAGGNVAEIWVLVDTVFGNDSLSSHAIQMYWGKTGAADSADNAPGNAGARVFSSGNGFVGAWHLGNAPGISPRPNAVSGAPAATPTNDFTGVSFGGGAGSYVIPEGVIGKADTIRGGGTRSIPVATSDYLNIGTGATTAGNPFGGNNTYTGYTDFSTGFTFSFWVKIGATAGSYSSMLELANASNAANNVRFFRPSTTTSFRYEHVPATTPNTGNQKSTAGGTMVVGTWQHVVVTVGTGNRPPTTIFINGAVSLATTNDSTPIDNILRTNAWMGKTNYLTDSYFAGAFDEPEISSVARSADWIKLSYETQKTGSTAVIFGATLGTATAPGPPENVTGVPGNGQVAVSWSPPSSNGGTAITGYTATTLQDTSRHCSTTGGTTCTVTGLTNGTSYTFAVAARNPVGTGPAASVTVTPVEPPSGTPGPPTGVTATGGNAQATVSWIAGTAGASATLAYTATSNPDGKTCTATAPTTTCAVTTLNNGTPYTFTVTATNSQGTSTPSNPSLQITPVGPPTAPANVNATPGNGQATITWSVPANNGGSSIVLYVATASPGGATCTSNLSTSCVIMGLAASAYTFTVTATNLTGTSPASDPSGSVTGLRGSSAQRGFTIRRAGSSLYFRLPLATSGAEISVRDLGGHTVWSRTVGVGVGEILWDGTIFTGRKAASGLYAVRMKSQGANASVSVVDTKIVYAP